MADQKKKPEISSGISLSPLEERLAVKPKGQQLYIGIPREIAFQEKRVSLTPESVGLLVANGHRVVIETKAGKHAHYADQEYADAGAEIAYDTQKVYDADMIVKITPISDEEITMLKTHQTIFSPIHLPTIRKGKLQELIKKKVTAFAFEYIKDEAKTFPFVRALSEIAGSASILIASHYTSNVGDGPGIMLGGITGVPPSKVVILGAGVVGEYASRAALGLGAEVKVFDNNIYKLMRLQNNIGQRLFTSVITPDVLAAELETADVVIGAIHAEDSRTPIIVTDHMVQNMKPGAVIIDVSIDQGGCFETSEITTHAEPVFTKHDVVHYCVPNISSRVSRTASRAISNVMTPILLRISEFNSLDRLVRNNKGIRHGVYIYQGHITNRHIADKFGYKCTDLDLIMAASI